jgi:hypothetical protein
MSGCPAWYWPEHVSEGGCGGVILLGEVGATLGVAPGELRDVGDAAALTEGDGGTYACGARGEPHPASERNSTIHAMCLGGLIRSCNATPGGWLRGNRIREEPG